MFRTVIAASTALLILGACPFVPQAAAADADQVVDVYDGQIHCLLSANYLGRGRAMAMCGLSDGRPFGSSPMSTGKNPERLNLAVMRGTGEMWWEAGPTPGAGAGDVVGPGQTYAAAGWTVTSDENRAVVKNDDTKHGLILNLADVRQF